jgi:gamma-glutamylcyclotransferase (GGCT)/AIG2-like uncharacterized protein YtfP
VRIVLFVYGTLVPGEPAWPLIAPYVQERREATVSGRLYDTGRGYPGAVFAPGPDVVRGWCCTLVGASLEELDEFEGEEYERVTVRCTDGTEAICYHWVAAVDSCVLVPDGRWVHRPVT